MDLLTLIILPLAVARLTRLVTTDRIFSAVRSRLEARWLMKAGLDSLALYLIGCPWCISMYTGTGAAAAWWAWGDARWFTAAVVALAASYVTGWLASREGE